MREPGAPVQKARTSGKDARLPEFSPICTTIACANKNSAPHLKCPAPLDPARCMIKQTRAAHRQSAARCLEMLKEALSNGASKRVTQFSRGRWAPSWPAGTTLFSYMFAHEAHHRGQAIMLAPQLGYKLPDKAAEVLEAVRF
jgi:hypothetical protein